MTSSPVIVLNLDPYPHYTAEIYPNDIYRRLHPRQHHPLDLHTLGLISALAPHFRYLKENGLTREDIAHVSSKDDISNEDEYDFLTHIDVGLFEPDEISVKIVNDHLVVEGKHEERQSDDMGSVARHFIRRYELPKGYNPDALVSKLSSNGVLSVLLPKPSDKPKERNIIIQRTGPSDFFSSKKKIITPDKKKEEEKTE